MGRRSKQNEDDVLNHWISFADGFSMSSQAFYAAVERELQDRKVPGLEISREEFSEGGVLSGRREYLCLKRERLTFYVCAAPFGTRFFFSCRTVYVRPAVELWHIIVPLFLLWLTYVALHVYVRAPLAGIILACLVVAVFLVMHNLVALGLQNLDATLLQFPGLGFIYERFFRKETYYRLDTRLMYLDTVPFVVQALAEEVTGAKGVKLVRQYQRAPILGDLYKPLPPAKPEPEKKP